jgi:hypothetical protein
MPLATTSIELICIASFLVFSLADLRYRLAPAIEIFFLAVIVIAAPANPLHTGVIVLAVAWGWFVRWPGWVIWPLLFDPAAWFVLLVGYGVRRNLVGRADLLAVGALACLFPWYTLIPTFLGLEIWRRWWVRRWAGPVPALPGMLLGLSAYWVVSLVFPIIHRAW